MAMALALPLSPPLNIPSSSSITLSSRYKFHEASLLAPLAPLSPPILGARYPSVVCGRGDKRTAKGKRFRHSFGNARPKNSSKGRGLPAVPLPPRPPKKDPFNTGEHIEIRIDETLFAN